MACSHYSPSFESLATALSAPAYYSVSLKRHVGPHTALHSLILSYAQDLVENIVDTGTSVSFSTDGSTGDEVNESFCKPRLFTSWNSQHWLPHATSISNFISLALLIRRVLNRRGSQEPGLLHLYISLGMSDLSTNAIESVLAALGDQLSCEICRKHFETG
ncbi:hypothetical protein EDB19DRAFT_2028888 [Suillus lakei]|nr:hypothetical protein EDB19DRAFT_2028888 [Suillus lakei]